MKKLFGELNLTWVKLIIFAVVAGIYTAIMALLPITKNTSFEDISISFEVWILFGILIIMNSKSNKDSALKCFVFFLISQPLVYLIQVPFSSLGWQILGYYKNWIVWTILTLPMGFIGYYMKKDKWWGFLILLPMLVFLGIHYNGFLGEVIYYFPRHLLSAIFCVVSMIIYSLFIFNDKKIKIVGIIVSLLIVSVMTFITLGNRTTYNTTLLTSHNDDGLVFDDSYKVYLEDDKLGKVYIKYDEGLEDYCVEAEFNKAGKTDLILEDKDGNKIIYEIDVKRSTYNIERKE